MQHIQLKSAASKKFAVKICSLGFVALLVCIAGCGGSDTSATPAPATPGPQNYFGPYVAGTTNGNILFTGAKSYAIDDIANTFSESTFLIASTTQQGPQVINSGNIAPLTAANAAKLLGVKIYTIGAGTTGMGAKRNR